MKIKKIAAAVLAGTMAFAAMAVSAFAADGDCAYIDAQSPSYTYEVTDDVTSVKADVTILMPLEGDTAWNDWCGQGVKVTNADGSVEYYQWGGASVTWGADFNGDKEEDCAGGVDGDHWLGTVADGKVTLDIPVAGAGSKIEFVVMSWDSYADAQYNVAIASATDTPSGDSAATTALILAAVAALAVVATVSVKKFAAER